jgi:hypothetical protein
MSWLGGQNRVMNFFIDPCTVYPEDFRYYPHGFKKIAGKYLKNSPQYFIKDGSELMI